MSHFNVGVKMVFCGKLTLSSLLDIERGLNKMGLTWPIYLRKQRSLIAKENNTSYQNNNAILKLKNKNIIITIITFHNGRKYSVSKKISCPRIINSYDIFIYSVNECNWFKSLCVHFKPIYFTTNGILVNHQGLEREHFEG